MKRRAVILTLAILGILSLTTLAVAQTGAAAPANAQPSGQTPPAGKRPPQTKTVPEYDAWNAASKLTDAAGAEKAADDFATKFPDSEVRILLYKNAMRLYQSTNNGEKTEAMGRKVLSFDGDDPESLVTVAEVIAEKTRDTDMDKEQRFAEAITMAQKAMTTLDTDLSVPAGTPQDKIDAYKAGVRSQAYSIIGTIQFKKENFAAAQENLQKSIDAYPSDPSPVDVLRLALTLDKLEKYPDALKVVNRVVDMTQKDESGVIGTAARRERDRLQQLTGSAPTAPATPPKN
jgi:tetratricopeptide (TPR) repeat protein